MLQLLQFLLSFVLVVLCFKIRIDGAMFLQIWRMWMSRQLKRDSYTYLWQFISSKGTFLYEMSLSSDWISQHINSHLFKLYILSFQSIDTCETKYCQTRYNTGRHKHTVCEHCGIGRLCGSSICQYGLTDVSKMFLLKTWHNKSDHRVWNDLSSFEFKHIVQFE